jgi:hypothetical protein
MPLTDSIPTIVSGAVLEALRKRLVYERLYNENYAGDVTPGGTVRIVEPGASVSVGTYTKESDISWQYVSDSSQDMAIDQQRYYAIAMDDVDRVQSRPDLLAAYASDATYQLQDVVDTYLAGLLTGASGTITADLGTDGTPLEINSANIGSTLLNMARKLDDARVPREGRSVVVPPWVVEDLVLADIADSTDNVDAATNGMVGRYAGFDIAVSHNVPNSAGSAYKLIAGSNIGATWATQISSTEQIRLPNQFADGIRGLLVYGGRVVRPGAYAVATANEAAEA